MLAKAAQGLRGLFTTERLALFGILALGAWVRLSHLNVAHFQIDQAKLIQHAWNLAHRGIFPTYFYALSAGYSNFPLTLYLDALPLRLVDSIYAVLVFHVGANLLAVGLCWCFTRRYWGPRAAALATFVYVCAPWAILYSRRIWTNSLMPPFVMLWVIACVLTLHERRWRWLALAWAAAWLLLQLHAGGVIFILITLVLMLGQQRWNVWYYALLGSVAGLLPALPWLYAHLFGPAVLYLNRMPYSSGGGLRYNTRPLVEFLTASNLANFYRGLGWETLQERLAPLQVAEPLWLLAFGGAALFIAWLGGRRGRIPERVLALWLFVPLLFGFVSRRSYTIVYYLPLLPAPMIAFSIALERLRARWRWLAGLLTLAVSALCVLNLWAVLVGYDFVASGQQRNDPKLWADGGGTPLGAQLAIAAVAQASIASDEVTETLVLIRPVLQVEHEMMAAAFQFHLRGYPTRLLDTDRPHRVFPLKAAALLLDENNTVLPAAYAGRAGAIATAAPYTIYLLPAGSAPAPQFPLPERPGYANGLRLLGYDALRCDGNWQLHWTPGLPRKGGEHAHFFVHLLDDAGEGLAQSDLRTYDYWEWRTGDHIVTAFDFGQRLADLPVETLRIGLYYYSDETKAVGSGISALDELGRPWLYAIDIPYEGICSP